MWYSAEEAAAIIAKESQDNLFYLSDDGDDDFPVKCGPDVEFQTEEEYTKSDTTNEELEQNVFGIDPILKWKRECRTRAGITGGIHVSGERYGTQPPQDKPLGTQPP